MRIILGVFRQRTELSAKCKGFEVVAILPRWNSTEGWNRITKAVVWKQGLNQLRLCSILVIFGLYCE